jgi:hypothetical protein
MGVQYAKFLKNMLPFIWGKTIWGTLSNFWGLHFNNFGAKNMGVRFHFFGAHINSHPFLKGGPTFQKLIHPSKRVKGRVDRLNHPSESSLERT